MTLNRVGFQNGANPDNYATLEHLNSKLDLKAEKHPRVVLLAHHKCNQLRSAIEEKNLPLLEIWYRASNWGEHLEFIPGNLKYLF